MKRRLSVLSLAVLAALFSLSSDLVAGESDTWNWRPLSAMSEAKASATPIIVCMNHDGEHTNDTMQDQFYKDPDILDLSRNFVVVMANPWPHGPNWQNENPLSQSKIPPELFAQPPERCGKFRVIGCSSHIEAWKWVTDKGYAPADGSNFVCPQHLFLMPDGSEITVREYQPPRPEMIQLMKEALDRVRPIVRDAMTQWVAGKNAAALRAAIPTLRPIARQEMFKLLLELGKDDQRKLVEEFAAGGSKVDPLLQRDAVVALGVPGNDAAIKTLDKALSHKERAIREAAFDALLAIGGNQAVKTAAGALPKEKDVDVIAQGIESLRARVAVAGVQEVLVTLARHKETEVRVRALIALAGRADEKPVHDALIKALEDKEHFVKAAALWALGCTTKEPCLPPAADAISAFKEKTPKKAEGLHQVCDQALNRLAGKDNDDEYEAIRFNLLKSFNKPDNKPDPGEKKPRR